MLFNIKKIREKIWKTKFLITGIMKGEINKKKYISIYEHKEQKSIFLFGSADYSNIGDLAISEATLQFLRIYFPEYRLFDIPLQDYLSVLSAIKKCISKNDIIILQGGGNFGIQYFPCEESRRSAIKSFPDNKLIMFPQTFIFNDSKRDKVALYKSVKIYKKNKNVLMFAREQKSKDLMNLYFENIIYHFPDMVLGYAVNIQSIKRERILLCIRSDEEKLLSEKERELIFEFAKSFGTVESVDNHYIGDDDIFMNREKIVLQQINKFGNSRFVITDRLHGMIFAAITGTPCFVFQNNNHKIEGVYKYLSSLGYIFLVNSLKELYGYKTFIKELDHNSYKYGDAFRADFEQMADRIRKFVKNN